MTEGYIGFGSELFRIPKMKDMPTITPPLAQRLMTLISKPYRRNPETLARKMGAPGTEGLRHRIGGLEKENITGTVSTDPHESPGNGPTFATKKWTELLIIFPNRIYMENRKAICSVGGAGAVPKGSSNTLSMKLIAEGKKVKPGTFPLYHAITEKYRRYP